MIEIMINQTLIERIGSAEKCLEVLKKEINEIYDRENNSRENQCHDSEGREIE